VTDETLHRLEVQIRALIAEDDGRYSEPGDNWLFRPNPDEASLMTDALADAVIRLVRSSWGK
jgi:hypothetical protein